MKSSVQQRSDGECPNPTTFTLFFNSFACLRIYETSKRNMRKKDMYTLCLCRSCVLRPILSRFLLSTNSLTLKGLTAWLAAQIVEKGPAFELLMHQFTNLSLSHLLILPSSYQVATCRKLINWLTVILFLGVILHHTFFVIFISI